MIFDVLFDVLIVGVLINSKDIFDVLISMFWSTKKTISTFWNFWPVNVLKFDVPTPSQKICLSMLWNSTFQPPHSTNVLPSVTSKLLKTLKKSFLTVKKCTDETKAKKKNLTFKVLFNFFDWKNRKMLKILSKWNIFCRNFHLI